MSIGTQLMCAASGRVWCAFDASRLTPTTRKRTQFDFGLRFCFGNATGFDLEFNLELDLDLKTDLDLDLKTQPKCNLERKSKKCQ